jgi:hypothetical protein
MAASLPLKNKAPSLALVAEDSMTDMTDMMDKWTEVAHPDREVERAGEASR